MVALCRTYVQGVASLVTRRKGVSVSPSRFKVKGGSFLYGDDHAVVSRVTWEESFWCCFGERVGLKPDSYEIDMINIDSESDCGMNPLNSRVDSWERARSAFRQSVARFAKQVQGLPSIE